MPDRPIVAIADDNPVVRETLAAALEARYIVRQFDSGWALLDGIAPGPVDLLLLDVEMPGLTGYETCRLLRHGAALADVPVIFLSAHAQPEDRMQGYAAGGNDYLTKPCDFDELEAKIVLAIDGHRRARGLASAVAELSDAASLTAEMMGEVGVVLEFQRDLTHCETLEAVGAAIVTALGRFGLEGCMRLTTQRSLLCRSVVGAASALEVSLLDHLASRPDPRISTFGQNLGFSFEGVTLLVRCPAWTATPDTPQTRDAMGRARDNIALLVEGTIARLRALDAEHEARQLSGARTLIAMTREALVDIEAVELALHHELDGVFEAMRDEFEMRFPQLGLTADQEDSLAGILTRHRARALVVLARGQAVQARLHGLVEQLESPPPRDADPAVRG